jgi:hypothetical protein
MIHPRFNQARLTKPAGTTDCMASSAVYSCQAHACNAATCTATARASCWGTLAQLSLLLDKWPHHCPLQLPGLQLAPIIRVHRLATQCRRNALTCLHSCRLTQLAWRPS